MSLFTNSQFIIDHNIISDFWSKILKCLICRHLEMLLHSHAFSVVQATRKLLLSPLAPETLKLKRSAIQKIILALEVLPLGSSS